MTRKEQVQEEQNPERHVEIAADDVLDTGPQHLHHHLATLIGRTVHLSQRRRGERLRIEPVEQVSHVRVELAADHRLRDAGRQRRHLVGQRADAQ